MVGTGRPDPDRWDRGDPEAVGWRLEPRALRSGAVVVVPVTADQEIEVVER